MDVEAREVAHEKGAETLSVLRVSGPMPVHIVMWLCRPWQVDVCQSAAPGAL